MSEAFPPAKQDDESDPRRIDAGLLSRAFEVAHAAPRAGYGARPRPARSGGASTSIVSPDTGTLVLTSAAR